MKTNLKKHLEKQKRIQKKIDEIQKRNPDFDFKNLPLMNDIDKHRELVKELIYTNVDIKGCQEQKFKCSDCICR